MAATPETRVKNKLKKYLSDQGIWFTSISDRYHSGLPDMIACKDGQLYAYEVKSMIGMVTRIQQKVLEDMARAGAVCQIVRPMGKELRFELIKGGGE